MLHDFHYSALVTLARRQRVFAVAGGLVLALPLALPLSWLLSDEPRQLVTILREWLGVCGATVGITCVPALVISWLCQPLMRRLFRYCLTQRSNRMAYLLAALSTLLLEAVVGLSALLSFGCLCGYVPLIYCLLLCQAFGLPWLLAAPWASWRVLRGYLAPVATR